jgi:glycosyltransferase involved in cell wall biosynthesis
MRSATILFERLPVTRKSLRIAVVTDTYPPEVNGVAMSLGYFVAGLQRREHEVQLIRPRQGSEITTGREQIVDIGDTPGGDGRFQEVLMRGIPIPRYPALKMGLPAKPALTRLWSFCRPDLVHIVTEGPLGWSALQAARKLKIPVCSDFRTNFHAYSRHYGIGWLKKPIAAYLRKFHNLTMCTMVPTESMKKELSALGFRNVEVVSRGVETGLFNPARRSEPLRRSWGAMPEDPVAIHVGRMAPEKNLADVISAFEAMRLCAPRAKLVLVGDGPQRAALQARCPDAIFAGMRVGAELAGYFASGDIFLFPSLTETYGNVTVEAMASGLAVVAYNYAAASEHIEHGRNGMLAAFGESAKFVSAAAELALDHERCRDMGARARKTAEQLDWDRVVQRLESVFLSVAEEGLTQHDAAA